MLTWTAFSQSGARRGCSQLTDIRLSEFRRGGTRRPGASLTNSAMLAGARQRLPRSCAARVPRNRGGARRALCWQVRRHGTCAGTVATLLGGRPGFAESWFAPCSTNSTVPTARRQRVRAWIHARNDLSARPSSGAPPCAPRVRRPARSRSEARRSPAARSSSRATGSGRSARAGGPTVARPCSLRTLLYRWCHTESRSLVQAGLICLSNRIPFSQIRSPPIKNPPRGVGSRARTVGNGRRLVSRALADLAPCGAGHQADPLSTGSPETRQGSPVEDSSEPIRRTQRLPEASRHHAALSGLRR